MIMKVKSIEVNNPGEGDCGPYAFAIGLIFILQKELGNNAENPVVLNKLLAFINSEYFNQSKGDDPRVEDLNEEEFITQIMEFDFFNRNEILLMQFNAILRKMLYCIRVKEVREGIQKNFDLSRRIKAATQSVKVLGRAENFPSEFEEASIQAAKQAAIRNTTDSSEAITEAITGIIKITFSDFKKFKDIKISILVVQAAIQAVIQQDKIFDSILKGKNFNAAVSLGAAIMEVIKTIDSIREQAFFPEIIKRKIEKIAIQAVVQTIFRGSESSPDVIKKAINIAIRAAFDVISEKHIQDNELREEIIAATIQAFIPCNEAFKQVIKEFDNSFVRTVIRLISYVLNFEFQNIKGLTRAIRAAIALAFLIKVKDDMLFYLDATIKVASKPEALNEKNHPDLIDNIFLSAEVDYTESDFQIISEVIKIATQYDYEDSTEEPILGSSMILDDSMAIFWHYYNNSASEAALNSDFCRNASITTTVKRVAQHIRKLELAMGEEFSSGEKLLHLCTELFTKGYQEPDFAVANNFLNVVSSKEKGEDKEKDKEKEKEVRNESSSAIEHFSAWSLGGRLLKHKEESGVWATENDLVVLATYLGVEVEFYIQNTLNYESTLKGKHVIKINQPTSDHWTTFIDIELFAYHASHRKIVEDEKFVKFEESAKPTGLALTTCEIVNVMNCYLEYSENINARHRTFGGNRNFQFFLARNIANICSTQDITVTTVINYIAHYFSQIPELDKEPEFLICIFYLSMRYDGGKTIKFRVDDPQESKDFSSVTPTSKMTQSKFK